MPDFSSDSRASPLAIPIDWREPENVFAYWADDPFVAWLDSQGSPGERARFSTLAVEPFRVIRTGERDAPPFDAIASQLQNCRLSWPDAPVPFIGGAIGFLGYELGAGLERVGRHAATKFPDAVMGFYDVVLAFDRQLRRAWLLSTGLPEPDGPRRDRRAKARADAVLTRLSGGAAAPSPCARLRWRAETPRAVHEERVARAIALIEAGDLCQANITTRFLADRPDGMSAAALHLAVREENPAPYGAYLGCGDGLAVASVSPERFLGLTAAGEIEARPIKGTRARGGTPGEDAALAAELLGSGKDRAENLMIVDLLRHDIGRVARIGSVHVPELAVLESFASVHHLVSSVRGTLRPGLGAVDLLRATFPGGSVTGAPKIRAMQVIHEIEAVGRGPYCGAVVWLGWDGAMDSSIAIRTLTVTQDSVIAQAGGGIVTDSDPADEYEEVLVKIRPLLRALGDWPA